MFNSKYAAAKESEKPAKGIFSPNPFEIKNPKSRLYDNVEPLYVGLDTETTGIGTGAYPLSFGICVYRNGEHSPSEDHHIITLPPAKRIAGQPQKQILNAKGFPIRHEMSEEAEKVHGLSGDLLAASYQGRITRDKNGTVLQPALEHGAAIAKVMGILAHYQKQGAIFVGHNLDFDWQMLGQSHAIENDNMSPATAGFNMAAAKFYTADSLKHAFARGDGAVGQRKDYATGVMRNVSDSRRLEDLCPMYGIKVGAHAALGDARSSVELLIKQINLNREAQTRAGFTAGGGGGPSFSVDEIGTPRQASVGNSGVDYSQAGPHTDKQCNFCNHLDKISNSNRDETGKVVDRDTHSAIEMARGWHKNPEKMKGKGVHPMTPQLVLTAQKRENNA